MITETLTTQGKAAITSDQWHLVHSHCETGRKTARRFVRTIVSEHKNRAECDEAARRLLATFPKDSGVAVADRDEVIVRPPRFKSLKVARRRKSTKA